MKKYRTPEVAEMGGASEVVLTEKPINLEDTVAGGTPSDWRPSLTAVDVDE